MRKNRSQDAWIWVAVAAICIASLARAQSGFENARAYAAPVIKFLSAGALAEPSAAVANHRSGATVQSGPLNLVLGLLPVYFIGLVFSFSLLTRGVFRSGGGSLFAPWHAELFQRPPPCSRA